MSQEKEAKGKKGKEAIVRQEEDSDCPFAGNLDRNHQEWPLWDGQLAVGG